MDINTLFTLIILLIKHLVKSSIVSCIIGVYYYRVVIKKMYISETMVDNVMYHNNYCD